MWKLMAGTIAESIYNFLNVNDKLPVMLCYVMNVMYSLFKVDS